MLLAHHLFNTLMKTHNPKKLMKHTVDSSAFLLDDPTPMPESALLMATAQIMAEGDAKHSPVDCNTVN